MVAARPMAQFLVGAVAGALVYHYGLAIYTVDAVVAHVKRVNHFREHDNETNQTNQTNYYRPIRFSTSTYAHWPLPRRPRLSRPTLPFRFAAPLASPPPSTSVDVALLEMMWGESVAEELVIWRMHQISGNCPRGKSLQVTMTRDGGMGAFCAPTCKEGFELVVKAANENSADYVCVPIRAPPPVPIPPPIPRAPPRAPPHKKKKKKRKKKRS
jgi:hypothetical protein